jgi:hypothetical protein
MDVLPLDVIGWIFTIGCTVALLLGAWLTLAAMKVGGDAKRQLQARMLEDLMLFSIWLLGLAGGIGVLQGKGWSRPALELFCWTLMILLGISAVKRFRAMPKPRFLLGLSLIVFIAPVVAVCIATILTLRSGGAVKELSDYVTDRPHIAGLARDGTGGRA